MALWGWTRTGLLIVAFVCLAIRDLPHGAPGGPIIVAGLVGISWGAIRYRWMYWVGVVFSLGILTQTGDMLAGFQLRTGVLQKALYGGIVLPALLASAMYLLHLFVSGRLHE